ncbi:MAG TPA: DUF433 domain-containing protein [Vicinamibacterales bacterium]|nr:DUF433 domain-containing protein [Vicinamibacterales bacterium]
MGATRRPNLEQLYSGPQVLEVPLYSVFEASRYLQIPDNTLRSWVSGRSYPLRSGASRRSEAVIELADPTHSRLSFINLTEAHVLDALRRQYQVELSQIRRAVSYLREHFRSPHPLIHHEMLTDGKHLFVEAAGLKDVINASRHGQIAMRDLIGLHLQRVEWDKDGFVARLYPFTRSRRTSSEEASQPRVVTMDPRVEFGRPILKMSAVRTAVIADRYKAGESIADLADDYGEDPLNIEEAVRCELQPAKAA